MEYSMARLIAVSFRPYRMHQLEIQDGGRTSSAVVIHPPAGRGQPHEVSAEGQPMALVDLINRAKAMIDAVMGPLPSAPARGGNRRG
jgi:hypothetical protein